MIKRYSTMLNGDKRVNNVLFFVVALLSGYAAALMTEGSRHGIFSWEFFEYAFRESFALVSVCAVAFAFLLVALAFVFRRIAIPALLFNVLSCVVGVVNKNKIIYRGASVQPTDIFLAKDAMIAAADYEIIIPRSFYLLLAASIVWCLLTLPIKTPTLPFRTRVRRVAANAAAAAVSLALAVGIIVGVFWSESALRFFGYSYSPKTLQMESLNNTFYPSFFRAMPVLFVKAPDGYGKDTMEEVAGDIAQNGNDANAGVEADIIIIQLESYFIPDTYDFEYDKNEVFGDLLDLREQGASGWMVSPQTGGGTADVEFEVLTGFTSNDEQCLVNPFSVYVTEETPSIVGYLKEKGYTAVSVHSHTSGLYNRVNAYKTLGFDKSVFSTDFEDPDMFGSFISEASCVDRVIEEYDAIVAQGEKALIHTVTMQNHALLPLNDYTEEELVSVTSATLSEEDIYLAQVYLTSCKDIAEELSRLAQHLESSGRDVILVIYGDHQSSLLRDVGETEFYAVPLAQAYATDNSDKTFLMSHRTPLFVWSSFGYAGEKDLGVLAPNAVLPTVLRSLDVTRPAYFDYLTDSADAYRSVTGNYIIYEDGTLTTDIPEAAREDKRERLLVQHDFLHGKRYLAGCMY